MEDLRRHIGMVHQDVFLFDGTIAENIGYGKPGATLDEIIDAAVAAEAHEFIAAKPDGYDMKVGERGGTTLRRRKATNRHRTGDSARPEDPDPR